MSKTYNNSITNKLINKICDGRLTLESGVAISTTNQTAKTVVYFTPHNGNTIGLYDGSEWDLFSFSELSLSLSGYTANTNYDIFIYNNNGTLTLESAAWTNNTTRATNIVLQDGIYVKSGTVTRRYLGTIRTTGTTGQCEDSVTKRFVWNYYNRSNRLLNNEITTDWTYATNTWRPLNNTINAVEIVYGLSSDIDPVIFLTIGALYTIASATTTAYAIGVAKNGDNSPLLSTRVLSTSTGHVQLTISGYFENSIGYHYYYPIENRVSGGTPAIYGSSNTGHFGGMIGTWRC